MKQPARFLTVSTALLVGTYAYGVNKQNFNAYYGARSAASTPTQVHRAKNAPPPAAVTSTDEQRGVPTFLWAAKDQSRPPTEALRTPEDAARWYLNQHRARYGVSRSALEAAGIAHVHDTGRGGIIVTFRQQIDRIDLVRSDVKVLMNRNLELIAISGTPHPAAVPGKATGRLAFRVSQAQALATAVSDRYDIDVRPSDLYDTGVTKAGYRYLDFSRRPQYEGVELRFVEPARVKKVFFPLPDRLTPAWYVEFLAGKADESMSTATAIIVSADDGRVLLIQNLTDDASFNYRVWTDTTGDLRPLEGPQSDYFPHPVGEPDGSSPAFIEPDLVTMEGFNTNPSQTSDPWLAEDATQTSGNNVEAYSDYYVPDGYSDGDIYATTTSANTFDRVYDTAQDPLASEDQTMAALTHIFYVTNWLHDWYYDSGFDEAAGVAQLSNLGRGGIEGDPMHAEGQDSALSTTRNNANMSSLSDGASPRMQMYLWTGVTNAQVEALDSTLEAGTASFGPTDFDVSGTLVLANDQSGTTTDACQLIKNNVNGKIAVIDRGTCDFQYKAINAELGGAIGVLIVNNVDGDPPAMGAAYPGIEVNVPTLSITLADGNALKSAMQTSTVTARLFRETDVERDGTIDGSVIAHEWGHYLHHRNVLNCSNQQCGAESEGWGDFTAAHMLYHEGDDPNATYALAIYAAAGLGGDSAYYGIRRAPYSTDFTKNALTFRHIQDGEPLPTDTTDMQSTGVENSEVHNAGEIWAMMMWEAYMALQNEAQGASPRYSFDEARRRMSDYVVSGMMMAPVDPTYTEQRDGILAAAAAADTQDFLALAEAFARRGAGTCAVSPPRDSEDLVGVIEDYNVAPELSFVSMDLDDSLSSCDHDGYLDAGETGVVTVEVMNSGAEVLSDTQVTVSSTTAGVTFPNGTTATIGAVDPFGVGTATIQVSLDESFSGIGYVDLSLAISNSSACTTVVNASDSIRVNFDDIANASATETVESEDIVWTISEQGVSDVWNREADSSTNHIFHGSDPDGITDSSLESPDLEVSSSENFAISFAHAYEFETSPAEEGGPDVYWDGGVIELSTDGGASWSDISSWADPGYNGTIGYEDASNPLYTREGYVDTNPSYPSQDTVSMNLGTALAGQSVRIRFRIGSDEAVGATGWMIDNISFQGITNLPFSTITDDSAEMAAYYVDADGDGYGTGDPIISCEPTSGYVTNHNDCDDSDPLSYLGAQEVCDGVDNNCDGQIDEAVSDGTAYYVDADGDGYGAPGDAVISCERPEGFAANADDCDDDDASVYLDAPEICDLQDNDCDGDVDEEVTDGTAYYPDADQDGHGAGDGAVLDCSAPDGYVASNDDCDDSDPMTYTGANEICDSIDNDCDGSIDNNATDGTVYFRDSDDDGFGTADQAMVSCAPTSGYVDNADDCDDSDAETNPAASEICDGADNDCNGEVDDNAVDATTYYLDSDGDGYGADGESFASCEAPIGFVSNADDCNDSDATVYPGAEESGSDGIDHNCDGVVETTETPTPSADDDTTSGDDDTTSGDDDTTSGDDDTTSGDDDTTSGDDDTTSGDDDTTSGDDDTTSGDDDTTSGDDDTTSGDDDTTSGDDDTTSGDDDTTSGDDDTTSGDDDTSGSDGSDGGGCSCSQPGSTSGSPTVLPMVTMLVAGGLIRRRRNLRR